MGRFFRVIPPSTRLTKDNTWFLRLWISVLSWPSHTFLVKTSSYIMIKVEGLTKRYARNVAVDNISFEVEKGQIVGFLGPNGAGKTTTMRVLTCFLPPTAGTATWPDSTFSSSRWK